MELSAALFQVCEAALSTFDVQKVLQRILAVANEQFNISCSSVWLKHPDGFLRVFCHRGLSQEGAALRIRPGEGALGKAAESARIVHLRAVQNSATFAPLLGRNRAELAIPLSLSGRVVGVLDWQSEEEHFFADRVLQSLVLFSKQATLAIRDSRLRDLAQRRNTHLQTIGAIARQTAAITDLQELLNRCCTLALQNFPADHAAIFLLENGRLALRSHAGKLCPSLQEGREVEYDAGLFGRALSAQSPVFSDEHSDNSQYCLYFHGSRSELYLPLVTFAKSIGVLLLSSTKLESFRQSDLHVLVSFADICAAVLQNAMNFQAVERLAFSDGLTGAFNRRFFDLRFLEELDRARRHQTSLSLLMVDTDNFKPLNDRFGHQVGDEVLRQLSAMLTRHLRRSDIVCRFGGDEFAVLLPQTPARNAHLVAEKLCRVANDLIVPGASARISLSIGVAAFPEHAMEKHELLELADRALYRAKQAGRNNAALAARA